MIGRLVDPARRTVAAVGALLAVVVAVVLALWADRAPSPVPVSAPPSEFSAERALGPLGEFATEPRPLGVAAFGRVDNIVATLPGRDPTGSVVLAAYDQTHGLTGVPGFQPRPAGLERSRHSDGDTVTVVRTYQFS